MRLRGLRAKKLHVVCTESNVCKLKQLYSKRKYSRGH